jgi:putative flippase GtrA
VKVLIIFVILVTLASIVFKYSREKDLKKFLFSLLSFSLIVSLAVVGNLTRPVIPIYIAHMLLVIIAWSGLIIYVFSRKYYWWLMLSPVLTIGLFLLLEYLEGSRHGILA